MSVEVLQKYTFEGPYPSSESLEDRPGLYLVACIAEGKCYPVDVGESETLKTSVENHERKTYWVGNCSGTGTMMFGAMYTPDLQQSDRQQIVREIRTRHNFACFEK